jgi:hypothetical protein
MLHGLSLSFVLLSTLLLPNLAFAESLGAPAYLTMGSGLLVLIGLATYVVKQMRYLIRQHMNKPAK